MFIPMVRNLKLSYLTTVNLVPEIASLAIQIFRKGLMSTTTVVAAEAKTMI